MRRVGLCGFSKCDMNTLLQVSRRCMTRRLHSEIVSKLFQASIDRGARWATVHMLANLGRLARGQFPIQISLYRMLRRCAGHVVPPLVLAATQSSSRLRPRDSRDMTVPTGLPAIAAIYLYDNSSNSRKTTISR